MWRSKKFILIALLAATLLVGSVTGVVLATDGDEADTQPETQYDALLDKVCQIYNEAHPDSPIECDGLKDAIAEAQSQLRTDALASYLQELVAEGTISQDEADQYLQWRLSEPDVPDAFGFRGQDGFPGMGGMRGFGGMHGFGGPRCWGGPLAPAQTN